MKEKLLAAAAALTLGIFAVHAWVSLAGGGGANLVSGVWLALARDSRDGLFYRGLLDDGVYGGTRYFPLFFLAIAALLRAGLGPLAAGYAASLAGAVVLAAGAGAFARALGLRLPAALGAAAFAVAPYFVHESTFAIRVDPLASGLALFGLAVVARRLDADAPITIPMALATTALFTAAVAAKPTMLFAPSAAVAALLLARRGGDALLLAASATAAIVLLMGAIWWSSAGRAIDAFRVGALGGGGLPLPSVGTFTHLASLVATSAVLTVVAAFVALRLIAAPRAWTRLPVVATAAATVGTALVMVSPGTILANQVIDVYAPAAVFLVWSTAAGDAARPRRPVWTTVLVVLMVWMAAQNGARIARGLTAVRTSAAADGRAAIVDRYRTCGGAVLAESPLVPVLAGDRPVVLDPFALRVSAIARPEIRDHLLRRIRAREFSCVLLEYDPATAAGERWYRNVDFGWEIVEAVLRDYAYAETAGGRRVYVPRRATSESSDRRFRPRAVPASSPAAAGRRPTARASAAAPSRLAPSAAPA